MKGNERGFNSVECLCSSSCACRLFLAALRSAAPASRTHPPAPFVGCLSLPSEAGLGRGLASSCTIPYDSFLPSFDDFASSLQNAMQCNESTNQSINSAETLAAASGFAKARAAFSSPAPAGCGRREALRLSFIVPSARRKKSISFVLCLIN